MSIERTREGMFRVRLMVKGKRRAIGTYPTEQEALRIEAASKLTLGRDYGVTLGDVTKKALDVRELRKLVACPEDDRQRFDSHLAGDPIMAIPVVHVRRRDVLALVDRLKDKGLAHQTMLNVLTVARIGLRAAIDQELIAVNPATKLGLEAPATTEDPWSFADLALQARLLELTPAKFRPVVAFAMTTGLRAGEVVSLRLADVHEDAAEPFVTVRYGGPPDEPTKNGRIRRVPLFAPAVSAVKAQRAVLVGRKNYDGLLFPTERVGSFRDPDHVLPWATWRRIRDLAGAPEFRWHDLRHTCASSLVSGWWGRRWSLEETCAMLGHSDVKVTQRYAHLAESALMKAASETPGAPQRPVPPGRQVARELPGTATEQAAQVREILWSRLGDLNPRPAVYETAALAVVSATESPSLARTWQSGPDAARAFLDAVAREDEAAAGELLVELAMGVLTGRPEVRLALEALRAGPFAVRRGVDLATLLLEGEGALRARAGRTA